MSVTTAFNEPVDVIILTSHHLII